MAKKENIYSVISFFCGCGGLDLGFRGDFNYHGEHYKKLPFSIQAAYDFNKPCIETYNNFSNKTISIILIYGSKLNYLINVSSFNSLNISFL